MRYSMLFLKLCVTVAIIAVAAFGLAMISDAAAETIELIVTGGIGGTVVLGVVSLLCVIWKV